MEYKDLTKENGWEPIGQGQLLKDVTWDGNGTQFQSRHNQAYYNRESGEVIVAYSPPMDQRSPTNPPELLWSSETGFFDERKGELFGQDQIIDKYRLIVDAAVRSNPDNTKPKLFEPGTEFELEQEQAMDYIKEKFKTTDADRYFKDEGGAGQYPIDAIYDKTGQSQDHLVISQYRYKSPRAGEIWGVNRKKTGELITEGIRRGSALAQFLGLVKLPMPNDIRDSNNVRWGEDTMNAMEAAMLRAVGNPTDEVIGGAAFAAGASLLGQDFTEAFKDAIGAAKFTQIAASVKGQDKTKAMASILGPEVVARILASQGIETSAASILARRDGVIPNSNLELLFSAPMLRQFSFMYKMSPRSEKEASMVNRIVRFFKQGMAPRKQNSQASLQSGTSYFLGTPNVFRLAYRTSEGEPIKGINRIKTCALTQASVNYTPEGTFASYDKGQPVSIIVSLGFQELEPVYDTDYTFKGGTSETRGYDEDRGLENRLAIEEDEVGF